MHSSNRWHRKYHSSREPVQFVGGEFYADDTYCTNTPVVETSQMLFLNGGKACLTLICDWLKAHQIHDILLPSYLCPTILDTLQACGITYSFYRVHKDLTIDMDDVLKNLHDQQALYYINYFGFAQPPAIRLFLRNLQEHGVLLIEDNAQAGFRQDTIGDFTFNSMRKLCAQDGGYLQTRFEMQPYLERYRGLPNRRLPLIRAYRSKLRSYLQNEEGDFEALQQLFEQAENTYIHDLIVTGDSQERERIEHLDWNAIRGKRRSNYRYLLERIQDIPEIDIIFPKLQKDDSPMGLPVYFRGISRDAVYEDLGHASIGLVIHWEALRHDPRTRQDPLVCEMASSMLTLAVDQYTNRAQLDYLVYHLKQAISHTIV